jgi:hypothetical protein
MQNVLEGQPVQAEHFAQPGDDPRVPQAGNIDPVDAVLADAPGQGLDADDLILGEVPGSE